MVHGVREERGKVVNVMRQTQNHGIELASAHYVQKAFLPLAGLEWIKHL
jgi:hypothetical protein